MEAYRVDYKGRCALLAARNGNFGFSESLSGLWSGLTRTLRYGLTGKVVPCHNPAFVVPDSSEADGVRLGRYYVSYH